MNKIILTLSLGLLIGAMLSVWQDDTITDPPEAQPIKFEKAEYTPRMANLITATTATTAAYSCTSFPVSTNGQTMIVSYPQ